MASRELNRQISYELSGHLCRISVRFNNILRPFDARDFTVVLASSGYQTIPPPVTSGIPGVETNLGFVGLIGKKGGVEFDLNCERQFFGITDSEISSTITEFIKIYNELEKESLILIKNISFFEYQSRFDVKLVGITPRELIQRNTTRIPLGKKVSEKLGFMTSVSNLSLGTKDSSPDNSEYFEILFRPLPSRLDTTLGIQIVRRMSDFSSLEKAAINIEKKFDSFIKEIIMK